MIFGNFYIDKECLCGMPKYTLKIGDELNMNTFLIVWTLISM